MFWCAAPNESVHVVAGDSPTESPSATARSNELVWLRNAELGRGLPDRASFDYGSSIRSSFLSGDNNSEEQDDSTESSPTD